MRAFVNRNGGIVVAGLLLLAASSFAQAQTMTAEEQEKFELLMRNAEGGKAAGIDIKGVLFDSAVTAYSMKNYALAAALAERAVEEGNARDATQFLGMLYMNDHFGWENRAKAIPWFMRAANAGDGASPRALGAMCQMVGDIDEAAKWYEKGVKLGFAKSKDSLDALVASGSYKPDTGERDFESAELDRRLGSMGRVAANYQRAAQKGHVQAMYMLGYYYERGEGVEARPTDAMLWYNRAAGKGHVRAMTKMGSALVSGNTALGKDVAQGRRWLERAAAAGDVQARMNLSMLAEVK